MFGVQKQGSLILRDVLVATCEGLQAFSDQTLKMMQRMDTSEAGNFLG